MPDPDFNGTDSFTYTVDDGNGGTDTASVTVTVDPVNDMPVAADDGATTDEDSTVTIDVLGNDTDVDGDTVTVTSASDGANGSTTVNSDGTIAYVPDPDFNGTDSFTYTVDDGNGGTDTASVTVTVDPVNDMPVAADDGATTDEDSTVTIDVLGNDTDVDGDTLSVTGVNAGQGTATVNPDNTIRYTPDPDFNGTATLDYFIGDGNGGTDTASVTVTVNPVADDPVQLPFTTPDSGPDNLVGSDNDDRFTGTRAAQDSENTFNNEDRADAGGGEDTLELELAGDNYNGNGPDLLNFEILIIETTDNERRVADVEEFFNENNDFHTVIAEDISDAGLGELGAGNGDLVIGNIAPRSEEITLGVKNSGGVKIGATDPCGQRYRDRPVG